MNALLTKITERFTHTLMSSQCHADEITLVVARDDLREVMQALRDEPDFLFEQLMDVCGVDYLHYGIAEWKTESATGTGFERGRDVHDIQKVNAGVAPLDIEFPHPIDENNDMEPHATQNAYLGWNPVNGRLPRFAVVYHLLSLTHNQRVRVRVFLNEHDLMIPTVIDMWPSADWFEREAFDLFGMIFVAHPDLRRILTDYGFIGHPFRKDFPLIGNVEVRYDAALKRVIYEPVSIEPRILEPKVIRRDNRYETGE